MTPASCSAARRTWSRRPSRSASRAGRWQPSRLQGLDNVVAVALGRGQLHRCRGLLAEGDVAAEHYEQGLAALSRFGPSIDRGRTLLLLGEHLRRERRRVEARPHLRDAVEGLRPLGARPWAERARTELRASGESVRRRDNDRQQLTPQERQVATLVVGGATNKEIAGQLYLEPPHRDAHLRSVYAKLGISSRGQLRQADLAG